MIVCTTATSRGVDIPGLTHIFIHGVPDTPDTYLHLAGRVGRCGQAGRVVTLIDETEQGGSKMMDILQRVSAKPVRLEAF
jgi:ATP-dependent RNA helicase DeaD